MSKHQLHQLLLKGEKSYSNQDQFWFKRYNDVIQVYNSSEQKITRLDKLYCNNRSYCIISGSLNNYLLNILIVLVFTFLPLFNIALEIFIFSYMLYLRAQTKTHKANLSKVQDPFHNFYYYPEMCSQLHKHFTTLNLTVEQIQNFKFNQSHQKLRDNLLKDTIDQETGETKKKNIVKVPIYDQYFYDSFFLVRKQLFKAISWSVLGIFLICLDVLFYSAIYDDIVGE